MSKLKLLSIAVIGLLVINFLMVGLMAYEHNYPSPPPRPAFKPEGPKRIIIQRLHFDEVQVKEYEELIKEHQASIRSIDRAIRATKDKLYYTLNDADAIEKDSLLIELGDLQHQIENIHYQHFADIRKLCRPDQLEYFSDLTHDLADYFGPRKKGGPPPKDHRE